MLFVYNGPSLVSLSYICSNFHFQFQSPTHVNIPDNFLLIELVIKLWGRGKGVRAPWWSYWSAGITNTIGPAMGIEALKYISYPAQVLAKSSKMIPGVLHIHL